MHPLRPYTLAARPPHQTFPDNSRPEFAERQEQHSIRMLNKFSKYERMARNTHLHIVHAIRGQYIE